jgi:crotonobetainyl-CoA:carnitine CoA-transferase CaiB-like acyl-CoA transferase
MSRRTILSLEQAVALPYATQRFVSLGWRVVRIEAHVPGAKQPGDPNRYAGRVFADEGRRSFFVPPNCGKEAIALNLKTEGGRAVLRRLLEALNADVFCCNLLPARHGELGVDFETLAAVRPGLIWASISALGTAYPEVPGYDPVIQAMSGLMAVTGEPDGDPTMCGVQITDLKAGDELYANVLLALLERAETGRGKRIDVSMLQAAASWLVTLLPNVDIAGPEAQELRRSGNFHRVFAPTGVYRAEDGYLYLAIGNTPQWRALVALPPFGALDEGGRWDTLAARAEGREELTAKLATAIRPLTVDALEAMFGAARIPHSRINTVPEVREHPAVRGKLPGTTAPDGRPVGLAPPAVDLPGQPAHLPFAPRFSEHTDAVLEEAGFAEADRADLRAAGVIP